jgi:hypothetical protein
MNAPKMSRSNKSKTIEKTGKYLLINEKQLFVQTKDDELMTSILIKKQYRLSSIYVYVTKT